MAHERTDSYLKDSIFLFKYYKRLGENAVAQCPDTGLVALLDEQSNSIATMVKHLSGNMISRWTDFLTTDGEKPNRNRDGEFENDITDKKEVLLYWEKGWKVFLDTLHSLKPEDLQQTIYIRKEAHSVMEAINRQLAHYAYHVGQIVYA